MMGRVGKASPLEVEEAHRQLGRNEWSTTLDELDAFISILYARGLYGANNLELDCLWSVVWGPPFFPDTMVRDRFKERTYEISEIRQKKLPDLNAFKQINSVSVWKKFIKNSITCYKIGPYITIDEQLFPSKARNQLTQYMPSKPDKFGIKF
ncbi:piggyBac transposable element-derived protein 4 [Trichonephila clavipes]|nr:piggyBac transposable element-derived protein 4 [Trichonephila clavipes]